MEYICFWSIYLTVFQKSGLLLSLYDMPYFVDDFRTICFLCVIYLICHPEASRFKNCLFSVAHHQSLKHWCCSLTPSWSFQLILLYEQRLYKTLPKHSTSWGLGGIEFAPSCNGQPLLLHCSNTECQVGDWWEKSKSLN